MIDDTNSSDDLNGWLWNAVKNRSQLLTPVGLTEEPAKKLLLVHYSVKEGIRPDFTSTRYHWTTHISNRHLNTANSTGNALWYTDLFFLKLWLPAEWDDLDIFNGEHFPPIRAGRTKNGSEIALDFTRGWLGEHGISLSLGERYMGHIKLGIDENTGLFYERV